MLDIADADVGGARVRRTFTRGESRLRAGEYLTAEEVLAIPVANRRALVDSNFLEVFPKAVVQTVSNQQPTEKFIVGVGKDKFNVIEGWLLNDEPINKQAAEQLVANS